MKLSQLVTVIGGWGLVLVGFAGLVLPVVPGVPLLLIGLGLLSPRFAWARNVLEAVHGKGVAARRWLAAKHETQEKRVPDALVRRQVIIRAARTAGI